MVSYSRGFGIDEKTAYVSIAARCEKFERFIEAAEYYEKLNDRPNLSRVADSLYTRSKASYERSVKEMNST